MYNKIAASIVIVTLACAARTQSASAQFKLKDLDPTNKNSAIRQGARDFDRERLKHMSRDPRPGRDYTKVYIRNKSDSTIWVAIRFYPYEFPNNASELKFVPNSPFVTKAWYRLRPGERRHIANTANVYFYTFAEGGGRTWGGNHLRPVYSNGKKRTVGFRTQYIPAPQYEEHTINFATR